MITLPMTLDTAGTSMEPATDLSTATSSTRPSGAVAAVAGQTEAMTTATDGLELPVAAAGDPTSSNPLLAVQGEHPWQAEEQQRHEEKRRHLVEGYRRVYGLVSGGAAASGEFSGFADPEAAVKRVATDAVLVLEGGAVPPDETARQMMLRQVGRRIFDGREVRDEAGFYAMLQEKAGKSQASTALATGLTTAAFNDAMLPGDQAGGYVAWREKARSLPGYDPMRDADYAEHWRESRRSASAKVDEFRPQLVDIWRAMKLGAGVTDAAYQAWQELPEDKRGPFLDALAIRAKALPKEERATFWGNLLKSTGHSITDYGRQAGESAAAYGLEQPTDPSVALGDLFHGTDVYRKSEASRQQVRGDFRGMRNFGIDIRKIAREDYDPVKSAFGDEPPGFWEGVAYETPGTVVTSLSMAVPYVGPATMLLSMEGQAYEGVRGRLMAEGLTDAAASDAAEVLAPFIAIPQAAMEKVQFGLWAGKVPGFSTALDRMGDQVTNRVLRGTLKTAAIGVAETGVEILQDATGLAIQDVAAALSEDLPGVRWTGEGGAFSGFIADSPRIFFTMLPLSILGAAGGLSAESRAQAFSQSSALERRALGITEEASAAIDVAASLGPASLNTAIDHAWSTRDSQAESAAEAVRALEEMQRNREAARQLLEDSGAIPRMLVEADGISVLDRDGRVLGKAADMRGALRIAAASMEAVEDRQAHEVAAMASLLEATNAAVLLDPSSSFDIRFGETFDPATATPEMAARYAHQVALKEQAEGGSGDIARSVLGYSLTEFQNGIRTTVNKLFHGSSVTDVFHESFHGMRRQAHAAGTVTRADEIALLRALDQVMGGRKTKDGVDLRFIPEGMEDSVIPDALLDEAISEIAEMEVLRIRKGGAAGKSRFGIERGVVSRNLTAIAKLSPGAAKTFRSFMNAVQARWGLSLSRALALKKAERDGTFDSSGYEAYLDKLTAASAAGAKTGGTGSDVAFSASRRNRKAKVEKKAPGAPAIVASGIPDKPFMLTAGEPREVLGVYKTRMHAEIMLGHYQKALKKMSHSKIMKVIRMVDKLNNGDVKPPPINLDSRHKELISKDAEIIESPLEVILVYYPDGTFFGANWGDKNAVTLPEDSPEDAITTHNHPSSLPPSATDLITTLLNPGLESRILIPRNENGKRQIYTLKAKGVISKADIKEILEIYPRDSEINDGTRQKRIEAIILLKEDFKNILEIEINELKDEK